MASNCTIVFVLGTKAPFLREELTISAIANMPTTEDITFIRDKAVIDNLQVMVERNLQGIKGSSYLLTRMYIAAAQFILNRIF